jgi:hypothetical protein
VHRRDHARHGGDLVTPADARAALLAALGAQGLRVANVPADVTPPCVYVKRRGTATDPDILAPGARRSVFAVHWIPVRGVVDPAAEDTAHAAILAACDHVACDTVDLEEATVAIGDQSWPCWYGLVHIW